MRAEERDAAYLWDMLQAARDATATVAGIDERQLQRDRMRMLALERSMELIGEAARLSPGVWNPERGKIRIDDRRCFNAFPPLARRGQHSIRVNDQWRVCFVWNSAGPEQVEIVDYHG